MRNPDKNRKTKLIYRSGEDKKYKNMMYGVDIYL